MGDELYGSMEDIAADPGTLDAGLYDGLFAGSSGPAQHEAYLQNKVDELEELLRERLGAIQMLKEQLRDSNKQLAQVTSERETLMRNISCLYNTAKEEMARKQAEITSLRAEVSQLEQQQQQRRGYRPQSPAAEAERPWVPGSNGFAHEAQQQSRQPQLPGPPPLPPNGLGHVSSTVAAADGIRKRSRGSDHEAGAGARAACTKSGRLEEGEVGPKRRRHEEGSVEAGKGDSAVDAGLHSRSSERHQPKHRAPPQPNGSMDNRRGTSSGGGATCATAAASLRRTSGEPESLPGHSHDKGQRSLDSRDDLGSSRCRDGSGRQDMGRYDREHDRERDRERDRKHDRKHDRERDRERDRDHDRQRDKAADMGVKERGDHEGGAGRSRHGLHSERRHDEAERRR